MNLEHLYAKLPIPLQNLICNLEGARIRRSRYGKAFPPLLEAYESRTFQSPEEAAFLRDERLRAFVVHCVETVPYYRDLFRKLKLRTEDIQTLEDLSKLPVLTKEKVQDHYSELLSEIVPERERVIAHTSGTTGGGLRFATTRHAIQEQWAVWWRYRRWHGIDIDTWCGYFGGRSVVPLSQQKPPFWRVNWPGKQILFSGYHMSPQNLGVYVAELRRRHLLWLHGYPSLLALLAAYIVDTRDKLDYQVRWLTVGAENMLPQQADLMERAFGLRPRQHYGLAEAVANISECENGCLHVDEDFSAVEFVRNSNGSGFKIIGTNFTNPATPLLRYDTQDLVEISDEPCACGRPGRVISSIDGRQEDYVVLKNGAKIGRMDHVFKDLVNIREAQIYQRVPGEIIIRIVPGDKYANNDEEELLRQTRKRVGKDTGITLKYVDSLERSKTGKLRFVVSELKEGQL